MPNRDLSPVIKETPKGIRDHIRALIKLLIGEENLVDVQPDRLRRTDMALDMRDREGHIIEAIYTCVNQEIPPNRYNVVRLLEINRRLGEIDPGEFIDKIIEEHIEESTGIRALSAFIKMWLDERKLKEQTVNMGAVADDPYMDYGEKWDTAFNMLMKVSPTDGFIYEGISELDFKRLALLSNQKIIQARKEGKDYGPMFPFESMKAYFSYLEWGEVTLFIAREGRGKTTVVQHLEENIAWRQKLNCDVIHFSLETPLSVLSIRQFCRYHSIPYKDIHDGLVDLSDDFWKPKWESWEASSVKKENDYGYIKYFYSPDASVNDLIAAMIRSSEASRLLGRSIFFVIDHIHKINWQKTHGKSGEFEALRAITVMLGSAANKLSIKNPNHLFLVAQEGEETGQMFGGKFAAKVAQYVLSLNRERFGPAINGEYPRAQESMMIQYKANQLTDSQKKSKIVRLEKDGMYTLLDALGRPRYWFRKGDDFSQHSHIVGTKGNDNANFQTDLLFEPALSRIVQNPEQVAQMRKDGLLPPLGV